MDKGLPMTWTWPNRGAPLRLATFSRQEDAPYSSWKSPPFDDPPPGSVKWVTRDPCKKCSHTKFAAWVDSTSWIGYYFCGSCGMDPNEILE